MMTSSVIRKVCVLHSVADCRPILQVEMENSMNLRLLSHEQIENYNSKISNKGSRIYKTVQSPEHFAEVY